MAVSTAEVETMSVNEILESLRKFSEEKEFERGESVKRYRVISYIFDIKLAINLTIEARTHTGAFVAYLCWLSKHEDRSARKLFRDYMETVKFPQVDPRSPESNFDIVTEQMFNEEQDEHIIELGEPEVIRAPFTSRIKGDNKR